MTLVARCRLLLLRRRTGLAASALRDGAGCLLLPVGLSFLRRMLDDGGMDTIMVESGALSGLAAAARPGPRPGRGARAPTGELGRARAASELLGLYRDGKGDLGTAATLLLDLLNDGVCSTDNRNVH